MHVVVLGAGVVGVCTAYYLTRKGHRVTLVDAAATVAAGASHANGGQLSYSFSDAMAQPAFLRTLPHTLLGKDPAIRIGRLTDTALLGFGARFIAQCTPARARRNSTRMLKLALHSSALLDELQRATQIEFSHRRAGKLVLLRTLHDLEKAVTACQIKNAQGCNVRVLSVDEALHIEPAIGGLNTQFAGAVYSCDDAVADARQFCEQLSLWMQRESAMSLQLGHKVTNLITRNKRLVAVRTNQGSIDADAAVVCLGAHSARLMHPLGVSLNIYPVRGYSVTLGPGARAPQVSLTDASRKIVFSRLGNKIRIAGLADFVGFEDTQDRERIATLLETAQRVAPDAADYDTVGREPWAGIRPMTPTGYPYIGSTRIQGLHLNTGHGMLGWTTACASAAQVAEQIGSVAQHSSTNRTAKTVCAK